MFKLFFLIGLFSAGQFKLVPSINAQQQQWTSNLLNLFSDNFRNLLQQIPTSPLSTSPLSLINNNQIYNNAYGNQYSHAKDLQYSDDDSINNNGLLKQQLPQQQSTYSPAFNSFTNYLRQPNDYFNYQLDNNELAPTHQSPPFNNQNSLSTKFDDDPYNQYALAKSNLNQNNKNVQWDDYGNLGLNLNAYNLDNNLYNNKFNFNRLPVLPEHISLVAPPLPNLQSNRLQSSNQPSIDLQQSSGTSNLIKNNPTTDTSTNQINQVPQTAYSSFLSNNKANLPALNYNLELNQQLTQPNEVISTNSIEQQYEQANPFYSQSNNLIATNSPINSPTNLIAPNFNLKQQQPTLPYSPLADLNQLYNTFALMPFNNANNQVKNPAVIYYDNFINHQASITQNQLSSPILTTASNSLPAVSSNSPFNPQFNLDQTASSEQQNSNHLNSLTTTLTQSTGANAPNLASNLELTTQSQLIQPQPNSKATRRKVKRKSQRKNQRNFASNPRKKDELEAIER